jgi:hypothetical protein
MQKTSTSLEIVSQTSKNKIYWKKLTSPHYFYAASTKVHPVQLLN